MCQICNPGVQRNFHVYSNEAQDIRITYYSYNNSFKLCCTEDYLRIWHQLGSGGHYNGLTFNSPDLLNLSNILYKNKIITIYKPDHNPMFGHLKNGIYEYQRGPYRHKLTINIINITEDIILKSEVYNKLNTIQNLEIKNDELKLENNELQIEMTGINSLNKKLKSENHILKKEVEYYNSLKQKYDYNEMKQNKKILHNEYKRIYKLIKKNIGFNLC
jgi:FtsZ-binding cell division protein ZapB